MSRLTTFVRAAAATILVVLLAGASRAAAESANAPIDIVVSGGVLAALDNGDVNDHTPFHSPQRRVYQGRALLMVRAEAGPIRVRASSPGLSPANASISVPR